MTTFSIRLKTGLLALCLFFTYHSFSNESESVNPITINARNWLNYMAHPGGEFCVILNENGRLLIDFYTRTADDDLDNHLPIHIQYNWGGYLVGVSPRIRPSDLYPVTINGFSLYESHMLFEIDLSQECEQRPPEEAWPFDFEHAIVTYDPTTGYAPYPFTNISTLFPANIFPEVTIPGYDFSYSGSKDICCGDGTSLKSDSENSKNEVSPLTVEPMLKVSPNPFKEELVVDVNLSENANNLHFELFNAQGKKVFSAKESQVEAGAIHRKFDYAHLPDGVYYLRVSSESFLQSTKIAKFR